MTWTPDIIRARFIEACDTERRLPAGSMGGQASGYWPAYTHSFEDMAHWGEKRLAEEREMRTRSSPPSAAAISRYLECLQWTAELVQDERKRRLIWAWAYCQMAGRSFAERCRRDGWVKMTAYRRLSASFQHISEKLRNNNALLREPDEKWVLPNQAVSGTSAITLAELNDAAPTHPTFQIFDGERPRHTLTSPQAVAGFEKLLAQTNKRRRREQERRRKLGIGEDVA